MLISLENIAVTLGGRTALHPCSLELEEGGITVVLGRSGAGKSTLLRSLNRLNECLPGCTTTGQALVRLGGAMVPVYDAKSYGRAPLPSLHHLRQKVGMVFQTPHVLPMSIARNMLLPLRCVADCDADAARGRMRTALEEVGLWDDVAERLHSMAAGLSGGQQQRLCLARAVALQPEILLLDEPTASLDPASTAGVEECISKLSRQYGVIMVSHTLEQAARLGTRFVLLEQGRARLLSREEALAGHTLENFFQAG